MKFYTSITSCRGQGVILRHLGFQSLKYELWIDGFSWKGVNLSQQTTLHQPRSQPDEPSRAESEGFEVHEGPVEGTKCASFLIWCLGAQ